MEERKRFQNQILNSEDYEKTEEGAKLVKNGGILLIGVGFVGGLLKRYGPDFIEGIKKIRKN